MVRFQMVLEIIEEEGLIENSELMGKFLLKQLEKNGKYYFFNLK